MKYALIGNNIKYSISPKLYNFWFNKYSIPATYDLIDINTLDLEILDSLLKKKYIGLNFTQPYKEYLNKLNISFHQDYIVKYTNVINNLINKDGKLFAYNTDSYGFLESIKLFDLNLKNKKVLILGYGATGKTIYHTIKEITNNIVIYNRDITKLASIEDNISYINYKDDIDIVINSTSTSLDTLLQNNDIRNFIINKNINYVYDVNYRFDNSKILSFLKNKNAYILDGKYMLILQAQKNFELWFNKRIKLTKDNIDDLILKINL